MIDLRLIVITDTHMARPRTLTEVVEAALLAGAPAIQLRSKEATAAELYQQALELRVLTRAAGALLFINDRVDVALAVHADGVHLGPADLPIAAARRAAHAAHADPVAHADPDATRNTDRDTFLIGASTDDPDIARTLAADGADYLGCGAVFGTTSKKGLAHERIGTDRLQEVVRAVAIPVIGIGGITPQNVHEVAATGARGAATISAVMSAPDIHDAVHKLLAAFPAPAR